MTTKNLSRCPICDQLAEPGRSAVDNRAGGGFEIAAGGGDIMLVSRFGFREANLRVFGVSETANRRRLIQKLHLCTACCICRSYESILNGLGNQHKPARNLSS